MVLRVPFYNNDMLPLLLRLSGYSLVLVSSYYLDVSSAQQAPLSGYSLVLESSYSSDVSSAQQAPLSGYSFVLQ